MFNLYYDLDELYQERISSLSGDIQAASEDKVRALEKRVRQLKRERRKNFLTWD